MLRLAQFNHSETPPPSTWGVPGDQLKRCGEYETAEVFETGELNIVPYYNGNWDWVLRPIDYTKAIELAHKAEISCRNPKIGYGQTNDRESFYRELKEVEWHPDRIAHDCNGDCSAGWAALSNAVGISVPPSAWTGSMRQAAGDSGEYLVIPAKDVAPYYLLPGDALLREPGLDYGGHTATVLDSGEEMMVTFSATLNDGTWNCRTRPEIGAAPIEIYEGGESLNVWLPAINRDNRTWFFVYNRTRENKRRGFMSAAAFAPRVGLEAVDDTWLRLGAGLQSEKLCVIPRGAVVYFGGSSRKDDRGVRWYLVAYANRWGWASSKNIKGKEE